ncbi:imidazole glycerol phosphate synthase subunit HisH [Paraeggerthella hongkongensis]|uniref:Imidazole glycerol phosphate synthase subunit HisH n=1 Tax=Paraeggerthella hongkongensis TaxID=230658 RepID=A0A3N0BGC1_9ACTN|nr:imidazole glycerol phosphate synthase subunit HisH [Paraeggerthella hongkongensis]RNL46907.1 imidazole glycerol phosphate synthase subunit HisH [Paraeggerthella hongkongensis]
MIAVVDYHKGNLKSVARGLAAAGGEVLVTDDAAVIATADAVVLPGVGAFADASTSMRELGQMDVVRARIAAGAPFLGICLGQHLMFEEGVEGAPEADDEASSHNAPGLAVLPGVVAKMPSVDTAGRLHKVPHVGWNTVEVADPSCPLLEGIVSGTYFYFTHSYVAPSGLFVAAETTHSAPFPSVVQYGQAAFGVQFHPEKSSDAGAALLRNFVDIVKGA